MSENRTLARPYARAAFEAAGADADAWQGKLRFAAAVAAEPRARALLGDPRLDAAGLRTLLLPPDEAVDSGFARFVDHLAANRRVVLLPEIAELFDALKRERDGVLRVRVRAASALEGEQAEALREALKRRFGKRVELDAEVDPELIGGAVIDAGEIVIDGSVRGHLARLERALTQ